MQKLGDLTKWRPLTGDAGEGVQFPGEARNVRLEVSAPEPTALYIEYGGEERFLARVEGLDRIEFTVPGDFVLFADKDCMFHTVDGDRVVNVDIAPVIFTRIATRKARNPNLEMMEWKMRQNLERRMQAMEADALQRIRDTVNQYAPARKTFVPPPLDPGRQSEAESSERPGAKPSAADPAKGSGDGGKTAAPGKGKAAAAAAPGDD